MVADNQYGLLTQFIGYFENETVNYCAWQPSSRSDGETYIMPHPVYHDRLLMFIQAVYDGGIMLQDYMDRLHGIVNSNNNEPIKMIDDINDIDTTRALLTYYVRAERFCDGSWAVAAENKVFLKI